MTEMQSMSWDSMGKAELLRRVQSHQFVMRDLALYLDTHPTDRHALDAFLTHKKAYESGAEAYRRRFGALTMQMVCDEDGWAAWSNTPWPWEKGAN